MSSPPRVGTVVGVLLLAAAAGLLLSSEKVGVESRAEG